MMNDAGLGLQLLNMCSRIYKSKIVSYIASFRKKKWDPKPLTYTEHCKTRI